MKPFTPFLLLILFSLWVFSVLFLTKETESFPDPLKSKVRGNSYSWKHTRISSNLTQRMNKKTELSKKVSDSFSKCGKCSAISRSPFHHPTLLHALVLWGEWEHAPGECPAEGPERNGRYIPYSLLEEQCIMRTPLWGRNRKLTLHKKLLCHTPGLCLPWEEWS